MGAFDTVSSADGKELTIKDDAMQLQASSAMLPRADWVLINHIRISASPKWKGKREAHIESYCYLGRFLLNSINQVLKNKLAKWRKLM